MEKRNALLDASFLVAMMLFILGTGCLRGNISAQVGRLYDADDDVKRTRGYTIFSMGINVGAVAGPLVCGLLAQVMAGTLVLPLPAF